MAGCVAGWLAGGLLAGRVEWRGGLKGQHDAIECNMYIHTYCMYTWIREVAVMWQICAEECAYGSNRRLNTTTTSSSSVSVCNQYVMNDQQS